jgi:hypothetical protein
MFTKNRKFAYARTALILVLIIGVLEAMSMRASASSDDAFGAGGSAVFDPINNKPASSSIPIPSLNDWQTGTAAFSRGALGTWDYYLWGGFANSLIKKNGVYYLYYQGAPSYNDQCDSVAYRGIGVAKSVDGVNWTKSTNNPVISWSSQGSVEEGAVSSAAWVGQDGRVYIYYGANTGSGCTIHANARLAVSEDGELFQDLGVVLSKDDPNVWGSGDEIFPVGAYSYGNNWYLYYTPNGVSLSRKLGVAVGTGYNSFTQTMGLNNATIPAWGPVSIVLDNSDAVLFTNPGDVKGLINIYRFNAGNPSVVNFYDSYTFSDCVQASVLYDSSAERWLMSCRDAEQNNYLIKQAGATPSSSATFVSSGSYDGWVLETGEASNMGGTLNKSAATLRLGDNSANKQYRSILSFDTSSLPDTTVVTSVTLKFKHAGLSGTNPFTTHGNLIVDVRKGAFKNNPALEPGDFNAKASKNKALVFTDTKVEDWYSRSLNPLYFKFINLGGVTQFRLRFSKDDNNDFGADFLKLYSGNETEADRPQLIIEYYVR